MDSLPNAEHLISHEDEPKLDYKPHDLKARGGNNDLRRKAAIDPRPAKNSSAMNRNLAAQKNQSMFTSVYESSQMQPDASASSTFLKGQHDKLV